MSSAFNGTDEGYLNTTLGGLFEFTWMAFVNSACTGSFQGVVDLGTVLFTDYHLIVWLMDQGGGVCKFMCSFNDEAPDFTQLPVGGAPNGTWYWLAITYLNDLVGPPTATFYVKEVNKNVVESDTQNAGGVVNNGGVDKIYIGVDAFNEFGPSSQCGHRIWNRQLSTAELSLESYSIEAVNRNGLVAEYVLTAPSTADSSGNGNTLTLNTNSPTLDTNPPVSLIYPDAEFFGNTW